VEAVHVLRDDGRDQAAPLPVGDHAVAVVRLVPGQHLDAPAIEGDVLVVVGLQRLDGRQLLEAAALLPQAAVGPEVGRPDSVLMPAPVKTTPAGGHRAVAPARRPSTTG
jgi:hypothetical protein